MSLKQLAVGALVTVCTLVVHATAQKNELSGLIGRTFISDQGIIGGTFFDNNVHFGNGLTFEVNYARRVLEPGLAGINIELRHARPEIAEFSPHAKPSEDPHIQAQTGL